VSVRPSRSGSRYRRRLRPEDRARWSAEGAELLATGQPLDATYRVIARDGRTFWFQCSARVGHEDGGAPSFHAIAIDVTAQKRTEERFRALLQSAPDAIVITDADGCIAIINAQTERMFQYSSEELVGQPIETLIPQGGATESRGGSAGVRARRKDGEVFDVEISLSHLATEDGGFITAVVRDISERKRVEQHLLDSLKEKEALLYELHHRVKNNLAVISSLFYLQSARTKDEATLQVLADSQRRVGAMALVHEMLYGSHVFTKIALADYASALARQTIAAYEPIAGQIRLETELEPIDIDIAQAIPCGLVLNEMISNALKHGFPDGRRGLLFIRVASSPSGETVVAVKDDGVGLPPGFQPETTETLGLWLMKMLARQLDGSLTLSASPPGTEVVLTFRRAGPGAA
jgi:PAS domain S-box-containing protein